MIQSINRERKIKYYSNSNIQCDICGENKYASGLCPNCNKVICENCEIRILHEGVLDAVCPNCNYSLVPVWS